MHFKLDGFIRTEPPPKTRKMCAFTHTTTACLVAHFTLLFASNSSDGESGTTRCNKSSSEIEQRLRIPAGFFFRLDRTSTVMDGVLRGLRIFHPQPPRNVPEPLSTALPTEVSGALQASIL